MKCTDVGESSKMWVYVGLTFLQLTGNCSSSNYCLLYGTGAAGRNGYLEVMIKMAEKYKKNLWG